LALPASAPASAATLTFSTGTRGGGPNSDANPCIDLSKTKPAAAIRLQHIDFSITQINTQAVERKFLRLLDGSSCHLNPLHGHLLTNEALSKEIPCQRFFFFLLEGRLFGP